MKNSKLMVLVMLMTVIIIAPFYSANAKHTPWPKKNRITLRSGEQCCELLLHFGRIRPSMDMLNYMCHESWDLEDYFADPESAFDGLDDNESMDLFSELLDMSNRTFDCNLKATLRPMITNAQGVSGKINMKATLEKSIIQQFRIY